MNPLILPDTSRVIASYLSNSTLEVLFFSNALPSLLLFAQDQLFWHARVETLLGKKLSYSSEVDWRDTYLILSEELTCQYPSFWNRSDNSLVSSILLDLGYYPSRKALLLACEHGSNNILKFLLLEGSIDPGEVASLVLAIRGNHSEAVRLLLADPRVDPMIVGIGIIGTSIVEACAINSTEIVEMLLQDGREDPGLRDSFVLSMASDCGDNVEIARLLLADPRVNPGDADNKAIRHAAEQGRPGVVRLLLADPRVDPTALDNYALKRSISDRVLGRQASTDEYLEVTELLLADPRVNALL